MILELLVAVVVVAPDGGFLDGAVHPFDLTIGPRVIGLGEAVLDAVAPAGAIEGVAAPPGGWSLAILWQVGELDAVVGEHDMDLIGNGSHESIQEGPGFSCGPSA